MAAPMPAPPPVTTAMRPSSRRAAVWAGAAASIVVMSLLLAVRRTVARRVPLCQTEVMSGKRRDGGGEVRGLMGREVHPVAHPRDELRPDHFDVVAVPVREPGPGEVLVRNTWTSVDPGLRLRLRATGPAGYFAAFPLRAAMDGIMTVGVVVDSRADGFAPGDTVWHAAGWRDYAVVRANEPALGGLGTLTRLDTALAPAQWYLGPLGGMGLTAYAGLLAAAELRGGDVVWVSAAAGAVGSLAAQLAKLRGHRVIGSAGSAAKVAYLLDELGLDAAFDHRAGAGRGVAARRRARRHRRLLRQRRRRRISRRRSARSAEAGGSPCAGPSRSTSARAGRRARATSSRRSRNGLTLRGFRGSAHMDRMAEMQREVAGLSAMGACATARRSSRASNRRRRRSRACSPATTIGKTLVRIA